MWLSSLSSLKALLKEQHQLRSTSSSCLILRYDQFFDCISLQFYTVGETQYSAPNGNPSLWLYIQCSSQLVMQLLQHCLKYCCLPLKRTFEVHESASTNAWIILLKCTLSPNSVTVSVVVLLY